MGGEDIDFLEGWQSPQKKWEKLPGLTEEVLAASAHNSLLVTAFNALDVAVTSAGQNEKVMQYLGDMAKSLEEKKYMRDVCKAVNAYLAGHEDKKHVQKSGLYLPEIGDPFDSNRMVAKSDSVAKGNVVTGVLRPGIRNALGHVKGVAVVER